jgi:hypothetical protein
LNGFHGNAVGQGDVAATANRSGKTILMARHGQYSRSRVVAGRVPGAPDKRLDVRGQFRHPPVEARPEQVGERRIVDLGPLISPLW